MLSLKKRRNGYLVRFPIVNKQTQAQIPEKHCVNLAYWFAR